MASTASLEATEIRRRGRRRLIGAIALVVLLVVFVPMLLDSEPRQARPGPSATIPPKESIAPLPAPPPAAVAPMPQAQVQAPAPAPEPAKTVEAAKVTPKAAEPEKAASVKPAAPAKPAPEAAPAAAPKLQGFAVQVGAFRDEAKLRQSREKLVAAGVAHYTERLEVKSGPLTRLRAGPFATRAEAEAALARLKRSSVEGKVVPLP